MDDARLAQLAYESLYPFYELIAVLGSFRSRRYFEVAPSTAIPMRALQPA